MAVVSMIVLWGWLEDDQLVTSNIVRIIAQRSFMQFLSSDQFGMFAKQDFRNSFSKLTLRCPTCTPFRSPRKQ